MEEGFSFQPQKKLISNQPRFIYSSKLRQVEVEPFVSREVRNERKVKVRFCHYQRSDKVHIRRLIFLILQQSFEMMRK